VVDQSLDDLVEVLKILDVDIAKSAFGKIIEADLEASSTLRPTGPCAFMSGWTVIRNTALKPLARRSAAYVSTSETLARKGIAHAVSSTKTLAIRRRNRSYGRMGGPSQTRDAWLDGDDLPRAGRRSRCQKPA
jgi:hypothetical protein